MLQQGESKIFLKKYENHLGDSSVQLVKSRAATGNPALCFRNPQGSWSKQLEVLKWGCGPMLR